MAARKKAARTRAASGARKTPSRKAKPRKKAAGKKAARAKPAKPKAAAKNVHGERRGYENPLTGRYGSAEMSYLFSPSFKFSSWRRLWIALKRI